MMTTTIKENEILNKVSSQELSTISAEDVSTIVENLESNIDWKASQITCNVAQYPSMKFDKAEKQFTLA